MLFVKNITMVHQLRIPKLELMVLPIFMDYISSNVHKHFQLFIHVLVAIVQPHVTYSLATVQLIIIRGLWP
jgi:hypothetical protein